MALLPLPQPAAVAYPSRLDTVPQIVGLSKRFRLRVGQPVWVVLSDGFLRH